VSLAVAWFVVMAVLPWLMTPGTSPGPNGLALPAVQAYVPGYAPGGTPTGQAAHAGAATAKLPAGSLFVGGASEFAAPRSTDPGPATADSAGSVLDDERSVNLIATTTGRSAGTGGSHGGRPRAATPPLLGPLRPPAPPLLAPVPSLPGPIAPAVAPVLAAATPTPAPVLTLAPANASGKSGSKPKTKHHGNARQDAPTTAGTAADPAETATVPDRPGVTTAGRRDRPSTRRAPKPAQGTTSTGKPVKPQARIVTA
jgi:hypothetical protein